MIKYFLQLQWKSFFRAASFKTSLVFKIFMILGFLYFSFVFLSLGVGAYFLLEKAGFEDPLLVVNKFMIYYLAGDLFLRYALQKMPVLNIKPLLYLPLRKNQIVTYSLGKTVMSFFNWVHAFFFIPFSIVLIIQGYHPLGVIGWHVALMALLYTNNFLNIMMASKDRVFYPVVALMAVLAFCQYNGYFDITAYSGPIFDAFYRNPVLALIPLGILGWIGWASFRYFRKNLYLDAGLASKQKVASSEDFAWLNRFGNLGIFLKNDLKLILRNKRSKTTVLMGFLFLFYGLFFFTGAFEFYDHPVWHIFAGIFISGGFLFSFGQYVPSWDSAYYPLMMSQNIQYREYLTSKWYLIIIATVISTVFAAFYLYFGWEVYLAILVGAIYNIGVNSYLVLWGGAYIKTPLDLSSNKNAFGDKKAFNLKTMLLTIPKLLLPLGVYALGHYLVNPATGYILLAVFGLLGFLFKDVVFKMIERIYKKEKYKTLLAYKEKSM